MKERHEQDIYFVNAKIAMFLTAAKMDKFPSIF
jgi:hypothetical protein